MCTVFVVLGLIEVTFYNFFRSSWDRGDSRPPPRNSRWNDGGGGGGGRGGGGGGVNSKGFHGSMIEDPRLEKQLFNTSEHASQGINFDRVCLLCSLGGGCVSVERRGRCM